MGGMDQSAGGAGWAVGLARRSRLAGWIREAWLIISGRATRRIEPDRDRHSSSLATKGGCAGFLPTPSSSTWKPSWAKHWLDGLRLKTAKHGTAPVNSDCNGLGLNGRPSR